MEELKDLVIQTLDNNGVLNKIRAQLRANVFSAIEQEN
jgi:FGFR1 oncogene partner